MRTLRVEVRGSLTLKKTTTATATPMITELDYLKGYNEQDNVMHVRYSSWLISLPSSVKQQRKMTKFYVVWRT